MHSRLLTAASVYGDYAQQSIVNYGGLTCRWCTEKAR